MKQLRGFKYRLSPTSGQRLQLAQTFGCNRFMYNWALALRTDSYYQENKPLSYTDISNALIKYPRLRKNGPGIGGEIDMPKLQIS